MEAHRRPPAEITPEQFFTSWLPAELGRLGGTIAEDVSVRVVLSGDGGGSWALQLRGGALQVERDEGREHDALVTLLMSVQDWRAFVAGEPGPVDLAPPQAAATDLLFVDGSSQQLLRSIQGTFRFEVTGYNGRTWKLTALFNQASAVEPPTATFTIEAETYAKILARQLAAPEAYFGGKIAIAGDVGLGMQVGLALLPRL